MFVHVLRVIVILQDPPNKGGVVRSGYETIMYYVLIFNHVLFNSHSNVLRIIIIIYL